MNQPSKQEFEHLVVKGLGELQPELADMAKRKIGDAWSMIIDHLYSSRLDDLTYGNAKRAAAECTQDLASLAKIIRDD